MNRPWEIWLVHHTHVDIGYRLSAMPGGFDQSAADAFARAARQPLVAEVR